MRIGIDARELSGRVTGVGRHLAGLLGAWAERRDPFPHELLLYTHRSISFPMPATQVRVIPGGGGTVWEQVSLARAAARDNLDVFFAPGYTAPLSLGVPSVALVHDVSFAAHPEWFRWREGLRRRVVTRAASRRAALVLTVSDHARREIVEHLGVRHDRVRRIYPGVMRPAPAPNERSGSEPTVLFVGSIFNRRHVPDLIAAFAPIARAHSAARLVIVGDNRSYPFQDLPALATHAGIAANVVIKSYADESELAGLYRRARVFVLLSEYEGFGHPPLEALGAGVPAVLLDTEVAREVCGDAAMYVSLAPRAGVTAAIEQLLFDAGARTRILSAAPAVLGRYSWERAAAETLEALEDAARADQRP